MNKDSIITTIEKLKNNSMFMLSLTSKELFHSNFWFWILTKYPSVFLPVFNIHDSDITKYTIQREKYNFDLAIETKDEIIIIENKMKSLPIKHQLDRYLQKELHKKKSLILISFLEPLFDTEQLLEYVSYEEFSNRLKQYLASEKAKCINCNDKIIIQEYINLLDLQNHLKNCVNILDNDRIQDLWEIINNTDVRTKLEEINFEITFQKMYYLKLTQIVLKNYAHKDFITGISIDCGKDLNAYSDIRFDLAGAWGNEEYRQDLIFLAISLWGKYYRYYAGLHKLQCGITTVKMDKYDKLNKQKGYEYLTNKYSWFFDKQGSLGGYSYEKEMYLYKKQNISNLTVQELISKVHNDLDDIYNHIIDRCDFNLKR